MCLSQIDSVVFLPFFYLWQYQLLGVSPVLVVIRNNAGGQDKVISLNRGC
jgi:hypothetical protein